MEEARVNPLQWTVSNQYCVSHLYQIKQKKMIFVMTPLNKQETSKTFLKVNFLGNNKSKYIMGLISNFELMDAHFSYTK